MTQHGAPNKPTLCLLFLCKIWEPHVSQLCAPRRCQDNVCGLQMIQNGVPNTPTLCLLSLCKIWRPHVSQLCAPRQCQDNVCGLQMIQYGAPNKSTVCILLLCQMQGPHVGQFCAPCCQTFAKHQNSVRDCVIKRLQLCNINDPVPNMYNICGPQLSQLFAPFHATGNEIQEKSMCDRQHIKNVVLCAGSEFLLLFLARLAETFTTSIFVPPIMC